MKMTELVTTIEANGKGVRAFGECGRQARDRIAGNPDQAAAYFLLAVATDRFVDTYDDQPLLAPRADDEFLTFKKYVEQFEKARENGSDAEMLKALNEVSKQIAENWLRRTEV
uniref:hypothetical protein n=1 Tax=Pararhizobium sp. IMCC3301 TaxID=3067904 RepID=UPI002740AE89|nr:hypothetical protein [Pararhizobium sp. IMCC3301]